MKFAYVYEKNEERRNVSCRQKNRWMERKYWEAFAKKQKGDCRICIDNFVSTEKEAAEFTELLVHWIYEGSYRFSKEGLKQLGDGYGREIGDIFEIRDSLCGYPELTYTIVSSFPLGQVLENAQAAAECTGYARTLGNLPSNLLHVKQLTNYCKALAKQYGLKCEVLQNQRLKKLQSGGILSVNRGSTENASLVVLSYEGAEEGEITALVGKGVMYDGGGYNLKGLDDLFYMKFDMCGAANVLAAFEAAVRQERKQRLLAVLPLVENVMSPEACKPGDVITTMSGKTVEVYNPDAEGRLILCDALTYAQKKGAARIIDLATLTYSCQSALGSQVGGIFSNDAADCRELIEAAARTGEKLWQMPLDSIYHEYLHWSNTADLCNYAPGKDAGASVAACFLEEFIEDGISWSHIDAVGPSSQKQETKERASGATGAYVHTLTEYLKGG